MSATNFLKIERRCGSRRDLPALKGRRATVMGLGSLGGAVQAVRFLVEAGALVTVTDQKPAGQLAASLRELSGVAVERYALGGHDEEDFRDTDLVVANPAVRPDHPLLKLAVSSGVSITTEVQLFLERCPAPVAAVTGSNGKSTTTAMLHRIFDVAHQRGVGGRAWLGGNIGVSLLNRLPEIRVDDVVVMELSSFQLYWLNHISWSPSLGVVTNFAPNHLDWHDTVEHYREAKQSIFRWQTPGDVAVVNDDDADVSQWLTSGTRLGFGWRADESHQPERWGVFSSTVGHGANECRTELVLPGTHEEFPLKSWLRVPGVHNLQNAMAATAAASAWNISLAVIEEALRGYAALPHRLERVGEVEGREFFNDSLATTPESAIVGIEAFERPVVLLAGGYDKGVNLAAMSQVIARHCRVVVLMGQTAGEIERQVREASGEGSGPIIVKSSDPPEAFAAAWEASQPGDVVLLSPGCASYDWFQNFRDRGEQFRAFVSRLDERAKDRV